MSSGECPAGPFSGPIRYSDLAANSESAPIDPGTIYTPMSKGGQSCSNTGLPPQTVAVTSSTRSIFRPAGDPRDPSCGHNRRAEATTHGHSLPTYHHSISTPPHRPYPTSRMSLPLQPLIRGLGSPPFIPSHRSSPKRTEQNISNHI